MAKKSKNKPQTNITPPKPVAGNAATVTIPHSIKANFWTRLNPYFPGIILFIIALVIGLLVYQDYGISYDEVQQRTDGLLNYNYIFNDNQELLSSVDRHYGPVFELILIAFERLFKLSDSRDIFLMRHLTTHILFLISALFMYILAYRLFKNKLIASIGFIMLAFAPRLYAHSFFNTKDIPFLSMFVITFCCCQIAFKKNKLILYFVAGLLAGFTTGIRIMGIMLSVYLFIYLLIDLVGTILNKEKPLKSFLNILSYSFGFCFLLYIGWPFLWKHPISNFMESISQFSHYPWNGLVFLNGKYEHALKLPWNYFPTWFLITNPEVWLVAGFAGVIWLGINFFKKPLKYFINTQERNFLLYITCFFAPIIAIIFLHSVIYDDWRHLYFVYPSFVLMALYFINKLLNTKYKLIVMGICTLQVLFIGFFMINNHPFSQVYFNNLVSHKDEYLRKHYDMEYWGTSFKQGLDYLLNADKSKSIKISENLAGFIERNINLLPEEDRKRIQYSHDPENADYFVTNFRLHPYDYPSYKVEFSVNVLNSTILCIFRTEKDPIKQKQFRKEEIANFNKSLYNNQDDENAQTMIGRAYFQDSMYDSAEVHDKRAIMLNPANPDALNNLGGVYFVRKQYHQAIELYKKAIEKSISSDNLSGYYYNIGFSYIQIGQNDSAVFYLNKILELNSKYNNANMLLGVAYFHDKKYALAVLYFKKEFELNANYIDAIGNIASSYKILGNMDSASKYEAIVQKSNPGFKL